MGFLGAISLIYDFAIILGGLIVIVFAIGLLRLYWMKRRLAKHKIKSDIEMAETAASKSFVSQQELGEGDLFGVRALEKGFYGGVAQSQSSTATNSPRLSPTTYVDSDGKSIPDSSSAGSSTRDFSLSQSTSNPGSVTSNSSTGSLRLQPSEAELMGRRNHGPSVFGNANTTDFSPRFDSLAMADTHSDSPHEASTPSNIFQTNQFRSYAQWYPPNPKTGSRSTFSSEITTGLPRDIVVRYHASFGSASDPKQEHRKIHSIASIERSLDRLPNSLADAIVEPPPKSRHRPSQQDAMRYDPNELHEDAADHFWERKAVQHIPLRRPKRLFRKSLPRHHARVEMEVAILEVKSNIPGYRGRIMRSISAAAADENRT